MAFGIMGGSPFGDFDAEIEYASSEEEVKLILKKRKKDYFKKHWLKRLFIKKWFD